jgi:hypothetical protein
MSLCLRKLDRKSKWDDPHGSEPWLGAKDLRADALSDLQTEENKLSVWQLNEEIPLPRILAALAALRDQAVKLDFIVFDSAILDELDIARDHANGNTHDAGVNGRHIDLVQLNARKLSDFGARIRSARKVERYFPKQVVPLIQESVDRGFIDWGLLKPGIAEKIRARRS